MRVYLRMNAVILDYLITSNVVMFSHCYAMKFGFRLDGGCYLNNQFQIMLEIENHQKKEEEEYNK